MKCAVLFSGGKDSTSALVKVLESGNEVSCLISMESENQESYMFQSAGNKFIQLQSEALEIPLIKIKTNGIKELELEDLEIAIKKAMDEFGINAIVTGAIKSAYQSSRIQQICNKLDIWCINPLWQINEKEFMYDLINRGFKIMLIGIFAYPLDKGYLGKVIDLEILKKFEELNKRFGLSIAGEGGEFETFVLDCPYFKKEINIENGIPIMDSENSGIFDIKKISLIEK